MTPNSSTDSATRDGPEVVAWQSEDFGHSFVSHRALKANGETQWTRQYTIPLVRKSDADTLLAASRAEVERLRARVDSLQKVTAEMLEFADYWPGIAYTADLEARTRAALSTKKD